MRTLRAWLRRTRLESDLNRELRFHLEQHVDDLVARGIPVHEARRRAQIELGGADQIKERVRDSRSGAWVDRLRCDARDSWRSLRRTPATALTAIALIALVIAGNTTLFSMIHGLLTKPAPAIRATGLVTLEPRVDGRVDFGHSFADYTDLARQSRTLSSLLACSFASFTIGVGEGTYAFRGTKVTANYFDTLGVHLVRGRPFTEAESRLDTSGLVAVISYRLWQEQLHGIEDVLGQPITINGHPARIVGVAPERFQGATLVEFSQIWVPLMAYSRLDSNARALDDRGDSEFFAIGRLAAGVSLRQAQAEISTIGARLAATYPQTNGRRSVRLVPYSMIAGGNSLVASRGELFLAVCSIIAMLTVLIVCANVANLMLARAAVRQRETALRRALGASRLAIVRSLVFEGFAISIAACVTAYLFAVWTSKAVVRLFPPAAAGGNAMPFDFTPDRRVVSYAMCVALLATIGFTLPPAFRAWRQDLLPFLKSGEQGVLAGRLKLSHALVIVQLAFAVLLLTAAGLAFRSVTLISTRDLGFDKDNLLLATISTSGAADRDEARLNLVERVRDRLRASPVVRSVSYAQSVPTMPGSLWSQPSVSAQGGSTSTVAWLNNVGPDYLKTMGISPVAGQELSDANRSRTPAVMINSNLAETLWPGESAIGRVLLLGSERRPLTVGAVAPNALFSGYDTHERPHFVLVPAQGVSPRGEISLYVRYAGSIDVAAGQIRSALRDVDARIPIVYMRTLDTELDAATWPVRFIYFLLTLFAAGSLFIAVAGQYAVVAFGVRRRTRDFGVRIALGASAHQIIGAVVGDGLRWSAIGLVVGFALSVAVGRLLRNVLVGVTPTDAPTYLAVCTVLLAASLLACYVPARRAAHIDPLQALREE